MTPAVSPSTNRVLAICGLAAAGEVGLVISMGEGMRFLGPDAVLLLFLIGPPAFLAMIAWRRRTHLARTRRFAQLAVAIGSFGLASIGVACVRYFATPAAERHAGIAPVAVPLVQWLAVLVVWLAVVRRESREKQSASPGPA